VVQPECRVAWRDVEVGARVSRDGEVAGRVHAGARLHVVLEGVDVCGARDEGRDLGRGGVTAG